MNRMKLIKRWGMATLLLAAIIAAPVWLSKQNKEAKKEVEDKDEARGAAEYLWNMRVNPATGTIDINDVENARKQVDAMIAEKKASRAKSNSLNLQWQELGPDNIGGRTRSILFDKSNPDHMFAGSVGGGLWESTTHGASWTKYNDTLQNLAVSCLTQAENGDIYFGTGEGLYGYYGDGTGSFPGQGVWKSTDHGVSFHRLGSTWDNLTSAQKGNWQTINNIYADHNNPLRIYAAIGNGLQMSNNGGQSWSNPVLSNGTSGSPVVGFATTVKVGTDGTVLCAINNKLYKSLTGDSATFTKVTSIPASGRVEVAIAPSNPNVMYANVESASTGGVYNIYRSTDKFATATIIGPGGGGFDPLGNQGSYANSIAVAPNNQNKIIVAGLEVWKWELGNNWNRIDGYYSNTYVHADQHTIVFDPNDPNDFFIGCDGGLFESQDQGATFSAMNRLYDVTQFYSVTPVPIQGSQLVIGGTQDNGSLYLNRTGYSNATLSASDIWGGDGAYSAISTYNPAAFFFSSQFAGMGRSSNSGGGGTSFYDANIAPLNHGNLGAFVAPFLLWENLDPSSAMDTSFFIGLTGGVWMTKQAINFSVNPIWYEVAVIQGSGHCMGVVADGKTLFVGSDIGRVYRITHLDYVNNGLDNSGTNYNLSTLNTPIKNTTLSIPGSNGTPTSISVDQNDGNHVVITFGGYTSSPHVFVSHNALSTTPTFTSIQNNLPAMPVYSSVLDKWNPNAIIVGTEEGLFTSNNAGATWTPDLDGFPRVPTFMLKQLTQYSNGVPSSDLFAATHGRGVWKSTSLPLGINNVTASAKPQVSFYPNPAQDVANINYTLNTSENIVLDIYNVTGQKVNTISLGNQSIGKHDYSFNVSALPTGTYFATLVAGNQQSVTKFIIAR